MRPTRITSVAALFALVEGAAASSGHYDSGHLAVFAVVGGAVALGSSALGAQFGSAAKPERPDVTRKAAETAADLAVKVVSEGSRSGEAVRGAYDVAKAAITDPSDASAAAEAVTRAATDQLKSAVRSGAAEGVVAPGPALSSPTTAATPATGTAPKFCAGCGTPTRERARFCASCGRKLA